MTLEEEYKDICEAGFEGTFEDYKNYLASFNTPIIYEPKKLKDLIITSNDLNDNVPF